MSFEEVISKDFQIIDKKFYTRFRDYTGYEIEQFGWGQPVQFKVRGLNLDCEYMVLQDFYGDWILRKNYTPIKQLNYHGNGHWTSY